MGSPVRAGRDVDSAGRVPDFLVAEAELEAELESEDSAGKEAVFVTSPELLPAELLPESVADESDDAADVAVGDDAVGIATFPVLLRVGRAEDWATAVDVPSMTMRRRADAGIRRAREGCILAKGGFWLGLVCVSGQQRSVDTSRDRFCVSRANSDARLRVDVPAQYFSLNCRKEGISDQRSDQIENRRACSEDTVCS